MSEIRVVAASSPQIGELIINAINFDQAVDQARTDLLKDPEYRHYPILLLELTSLEVIGKHHIKGELYEHTYRFRVLEGR